MTMLSCRIPFSGFYGTVWESAYDSEQEQTVYNWQECIQYDRDRLDMDLGLDGIPDKIVRQFLENHAADLLSDASDYRSYMEAVAKAYAETFAYWLGEHLDMSVNYEFEELVSPAYYNFETDRIFVKLPLAALQRMYIGLDEADKVKAFKDLFTSRDGFHSFYDNREPEKPLAEWDANELYALLTAFVNAVGDAEGYYSDVESSLYSDMYEDCYRAASEAVAWDTLKDNVQEKIEELLDEAGITLDDLPPPRCTLTLELPL